MASLFRNAKQATAALSTLGLAVIAAGLCGRAQAQPQNVPYRRAEIWYGGTRVDGPDETTPPSGGVAPVPGDAPQTYSGDPPRLAAIARQLLRDAQAFADRGEYEAARNLALRCQSLPVEWPPGQASPAGFLHWLTAKEGRQRFTWQIDPPEPRGVPQPVARPQSQVQGELLPERSVNEQPRYDEAWSANNNPPATSPPLPARGTANAVAPAYLTESTTPGSPPKLTAETLGERARHDTSGVEPASVDAPYLAPTVGTSPGIAPPFSHKTDNRLPIVATAVQSSNESPQAAWLPWLTFTVGLLVGLLPFGLSLLATLRRLTGRLEPMLSGQFGRIQTSAPESSPVASAPAVERFSVPPPAAAKATRGEFDPELPMEALLPSYDHKRHAEQVRKQEIEAAILASVLSQNLGLKRQLAELYPAST